MLEWCFFQTSINFNVFEHLKHFFVCSRCLATVQILHTVQWYRYELFSWSIFLNSNEFYSSTQRFKQDDKNVLSSSWEWIELNDWFFHQLKLKWSANVNKIISQIEFWCPANVEMQWGICWLTYEKSSKSIICYQLDCLAARNNSNRFFK